MEHAAAESTIAVRALAREDLDAVVAIDAAIEGRTRRGYVERRLAAAVRAPKLHAQFAATDANGLAGYILARVLEGEFGRSEPGLRLEIVGVRRDAQHHGIGTRLLEALAAWARRHGIRDLRTQAAWNDHDDAALARRDGLLARAESHRRLRGRRRPVHARRATIP